jgi:S1-C subfamily serine protease
MTAITCGSLGSHGVEADFGPEDEGPFFSWVPPEDRLWRHPSEVPSGHPGGTVPANHRVASAFAALRRALDSANGKVLSVAVLAGVIGAVAATTIGMLSGAFTDQTTVIRSAPAISLAADNPNAASATGAVAWRAIDDSVAPSVVNIAVTTPGGTVDGSGLLLLDGGAGDAYVVTDRSLMATMESTGTVGSFQITLPSGGSVAGRLVGQDALSGLAVLSVPSDGLTFPTLGSVADIQVGDQVMVVGSRSASGGSVFQGLVSGQDQTVPVAQGADLDNLIAISSTQTSASSDGGPLLDDQGQVVGITVRLQGTDSADTGLTFAVPIDEAVSVAQKLIDGEAVSHPWLGISGAHDLAPATAHQLGVSGGSAATVVLSGGPAARAGLQPGDVVTSFDGQSVASTGALLSRMYQSQPGHVASLTFLHDGKTIHSKVEVVDEPSDSPASP